MSSKTSTIFYHEWLELLEDFTEEEAGALMIAILRYDQSGELPEFTDRGMRQAFKMMRFQVDRDRQKYEDRCEQNRENGKKGGRPSKPNGFSENPTVSDKPNGFSENRTKPKKPDNDYDYDYDNDNDNDNDICHDLPIDNINNLKGEAEKPKEGGTFFNAPYQVPSDRDVSDYFKDRLRGSPSADAEAKKFFDYYSRQEWKIHKQPIKYWMSVADSWIDRMKKPKTNRFSNFDQRSYDFSAIEKAVFNK